MANKTSLRKLIIGKLKTMDPGEIQQQSREVFERLVNHDKFRDAKLISLYLSTSLEIDTIEILKYALEVGKKRCFVPYIDPNHTICPIGRTRMLMIELKSMRHYDSLPRNRFGIKEMTSLFDENDQRLEVASDLDLMIVPGVAFSSDGRRLGHGKGYYDEFLWDWEHHSPDNKRLFTIGLSLREQLVDDPLAIDGHDFTLDEIIVANDC